MAYMFCKSFVRRKFITKISLPLCLKQYNHRVIRDNRTNYINYNKGN
jgi:hypothetical protein